MAPPKKKSKVVEASALNQLRKDKNDVIYTPLSVAQLMIAMCDIKPTDRVLDPCMGAGVFYDNFPPECQKEWCEIEKGRDFFAFNEKVDWVIGNPPYSMWSKWLEHTTQITDKFCYIFGCFNLNMRRVVNILDKGFGVTKMHLLEIDWFFSQSFIVVFERNKPSILTVTPGVVMCDVCHGRCGRGKRGRPYNTCQLLQKEQSASE